MALVGFVDLDESRAVAFQKQAGQGQIYSDITSLPGPDQLDYADVCVQHAFHLPIALALIEAGHHVLVEKPMAMNLGEARQMLDACQTSGAKLTISHQRYYNAQYVQARSLIAKGAIGAVRFGEAYAMAPSIHTDGTHTIHMLLSLMCDPSVKHLLAQVDGNSDYSYYGHRCDHAGNAFLHFTNGTYAHLTWGLAVYGTNERLHPLWDFDRQSYHAFVIHGETGRLELDGDLWGRESEPMPPEILRIVRAGQVEDAPYEWPSHRNPIADEIEDLIRSIEQGTPHPLSGENGYAVLEVIMGIYESGRRRGVIHFPVEVRDNPFLAMCTEGVFPGEGTGG